MRNLESDTDRVLLEINGRLLEIFQSHQHELMLIIDERKIISFGNDTANLVLSEDVMTTDENNLQRMVDDILEKLGAITAMMVDELRNTREGKIRTLSSAK